MVNMQDWQEIGLSTPTQVGRMKCRKWTPAGSQKQENKKATFAPKNGCTIAQGFLVNSYTSALQLHSLGLNYQQRPQLALSGPCLQEKKQHTVYLEIFKQKIILLLKQPADTESHRSHHGKFNRHKTSHYKSRGKANSKRQKAFDLKTEEYDLSSEVIAGK